MPPYGRHHERLQSVGGGDLLGDLRVEDAGHRLLPDLLVLLARQLEVLVIGLEPNSWIAVFWEVVIDVLDDRFLAPGKITDVAEAGDNLVAFLEERIVHELQIAIADGQLHHVEFLLVVLEDERGDLAGDVRRKCLSLDLDEKRRLKGVEIHASGLRWGPPHRVVLNRYLPARREKCRIG